MSDKSQIEHARQAVLAAEQDVVTEAKRHLLTTDANLGDTYLCLSIEQLLVAEQALEELLRKNRPNEED